MSEKIVFGYCGKKTIIFRPKIEVLRKGKNAPYLERLVHGFCPKIELFLIGVFFSCYCGKKRMILRGKNSSFKKGQNMDISHCP